MEQSREERMATEVASTRSKRGLSPWAKPFTTQVTIPCYVPCCCRNRGFLGAHTGNSCAEGAKQSVDGKDAMSIEFPVSISTFEDPRTKGCSWTTRANWFLGMSTCKPERTSMPVQVTGLEQSGSSSTLSDDALSSNISSIVFEDNEALHGKCLTPESKDELIDHVARSCSIEQPVPAKSSCGPITDVSHPHGRELKHVKCSYSKPDEDDPDVDSPCWKGIQASNQTTPENIELPSSLDLASEQKTCKRLNPSAPLFYPRSCKQRRADKVPTPLDVMDNEQTQRDPRGQEGGGILNNNWNNSSMSSSSFTVQPLQDKHYCASVGSSMTKSFGGGSSNCFDNGADSAMCFATTPNVKTMINAISNLADLLLQQCLCDPDLPNVAERASIKRTLDNLTTCIRYSSQHTSFTDSVGFQQGRQTDLKRAEG